MTFLIFNSGKHSAPFNMALDEALLENVSQIGKPVLRFYGWAEPAASFGYFQKYAEVENATHLRPLIRRPTGGGIVPHDADWTYSFAVPPGHEWHQLKAEESYRRIHEWIRDSFSQLKIATELASSCHVPPAARQAAACFIGYEKFDLLWRGKKIAGAAQRRNNQGLLIQGSVQPPPVATTRDEWQTVMREAGNRVLEADSLDFIPSSEMLAHSERLSREKYSSRIYNQKR